jgi:hypothetical protein
MGDFPDFLARLKSLNPDLDLSSFPSKVLPGVDTTAPGAQGIRLGRRLRAALFPVGVIVLLVWLAFEAFQST